ncbi:unnamed protein product, partial [Closterium sp. NIES-65]
MVTISRSGSSALKAAAAIQYLRCDALLTAHSVSRAPTAAYVKSELFPHSPPQSLRQRNRFKVLLTLLPALSADFLCVQEMDEYEAVYRQPMAAAGWESVYVKRPGKKRDGSGIFYRSSRFRLLRWQPINFNDLVPPDHPDQPNQPAQADTPSPDSSEETRDLSASHVSEATEKPSAGADLSESRDLHDPRVRFKRDCVAIVAAFQERASEEKEGEEAEDGESMAGREVVREGRGGRGGERGQQGEGRVVVVASSHIF